MNMFSFLILNSFSGSYISSMCVGHPKKKISRAFGSHEKCTSFLW